MSDIREFPIASHLNPHPQGHAVELKVLRSCVLHVMEPPVKAGSEWFTKCSGCDWHSSGQLTFQAAASLHCAVEDAEIEGHRHKHVFRRRLSEDAEFTRRFPARIHQV